MSKQTFSLDVIGVQEPCHEDWDAMTGDQQQRLCDHCDKYVHNLSAMPRDRAEAFVNTNPEGVCIRVVRDAAGRAIAADDTAERRPWMSPRRTAAQAWLPSLAVLTAGATGLAGCSLSQQVGHLQPPPERFQEPKHDIQANKIKPDQLANSDPKPPPPPNAPPPLLGDICPPKNPPPPVRSTAINPELIELKNDLKFQAEILLGRLAPPRSGDGLREMIKRKLEQEKRDRDLKKAVQEMQRLQEAQKKTEPEE